MVQRSGDSGALEPSRDVIVVVPNITAGHMADVVLTPDAVFKTADAVQAALVGAPLANLAIGGAWVSTPSTGEVTVRFVAGVGDVATANQAVRISTVPGGQ